MTVTISFAGADQKEAVEKMQEFLRVYHGADGVKKGEGDPEEKPAPKKAPRGRPKKKTEEEAEAEANEPTPDPDADYEKGTRKLKAKANVDFDDITEVAGELIKACNGDMKRAQELVYSEFGVRKVSKIAVEDYPKAHKWMRDIANQMIEAGE